MLVAHAGCLGPTSVECGALICPAGSACTPAGDRCVSQYLLSACEGKAEEGSCTSLSTPAGVCRAGVCVVPLCGDGVVDPGEQCDHGALNGTAADTCSSTCQIERCGNGVRDPREGCDCGDGTIPLPTGCNGPNSNDPGASCRPDCQLPGCGDGVVVGLEECEPGVPVTTTCQALGFYLGTMPACTSLCRFDTTPCMERCGDMIKNGPEQCDGTDLGAFTTCQSLGYYQGGALTCTAGCTYDTSTCSGRCGDGTVNGPEACEPSVALNVDCTDLGYYNAPGLTCTAACSLDVSGCTGFCGDRLLEAPPETCEGQAPPGQSCLTYGYEEGPLGCSNLCVPDFTACGRHVHAQVSNAGTADDIFGAWYAGPSEMFAVGGYSAYGDGPGGLIMHYDDATGWTTMVSNPGADFYSVWGSGPKDVFVAGRTGGGSWGVIEQYDGNTWTSTTFTYGQLYGVWGTGPLDVWAVGRLGDGLNRLLLHYTGSWSYVPLGPESSIGSLVGVWGTGNEVFVVGDSGAIFHYDGANWTQMTSNTTAGLSSVWGTGPNDVFAVGGLGTVVHYNGSVWSVMNTNSSLPLRTVWGSGPADVYAVGPGQIIGIDGGILHYDGTSWSAVDVGVQPYLTTVIGRGLGDVTVFGRAGMILHLDGSAWTPQPTKTTTVLNGVWGSSFDDVFVVGSSFYVDCCNVHETILHSDGVSWTDMGWDIVYTFGFDLGAVWGSGPSGVFAVGSRGSIYHYDSSNTWKPMSTGLTWETNFSGVWGTAWNDVFTVGETHPGGYSAGHFQILYYDGGSWTPMTPPTLPECPVWISCGLSGVWGTAHDNVFAVASIWDPSGGGLEGRILHYDGQSWTVMPETFPQRLLGVWGSGPNDVFAVGESGAIIHYDGTTWTPQASGVTEGLASVWGAGPEDVYAVGDGGTILHYDGLSWSPTRGGTTVYLAGAWGERGQVISVGESGTVREHGRTCAATETTCKDGVDGDCDGRSGCADPDCANDASCIAGGLCPGAIPIACGDVVAGDTTNGLKNIDRYACTAWEEKGREAYYRFTAPATGTVTVSLTNLTKDLDLFVLDQGAGGGCAPRNPGCRGSSTTAGTANETVTFAAQAGQTYFFVVDGYAAYAGQFKLGVSCP
jgi:cysteine-rich repeat protein